MKPLETADDQGKGQDTKEKKRRFKKERKVLVVGPAPESDAEFPSVATKSISRSFSFCDHRRYGWCCRSLPQQDDVG